MSMANRSRVYIYKYWFVHLFVTICSVIYLLFFLIDKEDLTHWTNTISIIVVVMMTYQLSSLKLAKYSYNSFEMWFIGLSYLFMFGQVLLDGLFRIKEIEALGHLRPVIDPRYDAALMYKASIFIILCIQMIFLFFVINKRPNLSVNENNNDDIFVTGVALIVIGLPSHLLYSLQMIISAQASGSYNGIGDNSGLIDDFANFFIYSIICLLFSKKISEKRIKLIIALIIVYFAIVMALTGDRRYQIVSIITITLAYIKSYNPKIGWKWLIIIVSSYFVLSLFYLIREIRESNLTSLMNFFSLFYKVAIDSNSNVLSQTLYEFGGSFYTVCLALKYIPSILNYKFGLTIVSGIISIIPLGFIYQDFSLYQFGRLASQLMELGKTTVGGSVYADIYGNFGIYFGLLFAGLLGYLLHVLFNKKSSNTLNEVNYYILFYALIHLARASFTEVIRTSVWGIFVTFIVFVFVRGRIENAHNSKE